MGRLSKGLRVFKWNIDKVYEHLNSFIFILKMKVEINLLINQRRRGMTRRWFKFCIDSPGNVPGNRAPGYTVEEAVMNALDLITAKPENKNDSPCFEIDLKLVETTRGCKNATYYRTGKCIQLDKPVVVKNDCKDCCECCREKKGRV